MMVNLRAKSKDQEENLRKVRKSNLLDERLAVDDDALVAVDRHHLKWTKFDDFLRR